jgi:hypothetical protein
MPQKTPTKAQIKKMKAELARLNAFIGEAEGTTAPATGSCRVIGFPNEGNTTEYGTEYSYMEFVDENNKPLGSPRGNSEAEELLKEIKAVRYGKTKRGKARFDKGAAAWSIQTPHVPAFVIMGTKNAKGVFTASK